MSSKLPTVSGLRGRAATSIRNTFSLAHIKELFTRRSFKAGSFTALFCVVVIALCVAAVCVAGALPATYTSFDVSSDQTTSISEETQEYLAEIDKDVTIYLIAEEGSEDSYLSVLLDRYVAASSHISVEQKAPTLYPTFTSQYTSEELSDNSLIIVCGDSFEVVDYYDIYTLNSSTYSYEFGGESAITSAIVSLTSEDLPLVYALTGHGESDIPSNITTSMDSANIASDTLSLLSSDAVPDDADAVLICSPTSDISEDEKNKLLTYLEGGGHLLLITDYTGTDLPNLLALVSEYGLEAQEGIVVEGNSSMALSGYPYYLLPTIGSHDITESIEANSYVIMPLAHGIAEIENDESTVSITALLSTSSSAYVKVDAYNATSLAQDEGDIEGQTMVGVAVSEELDDGSETRLVWFSTSAFLDSNVDSLVGNNNSKLFLNSLSWLAGSDTTAVSVSLAAKGMGSTMLTVDASSATILSAFVVGVVPLFFLVVGFLVWRQRRARRHIDTSLSSSEL